MALDDLLRPLLKQVELSALVVTADALHTWRAHTQFRTTHGAYCVLIVKGDQPTLWCEIDDYAWQRVSVRHCETTRSRGRTETRTLKVMSAGSEVVFPHRRQIFRIERTVTRRGRSDSIVEAYGITSLGPLDADARDLARYVRGHWGIEALQHIRDVTYRGDAGRIRTGAAPRVTATARNTAISLLEPAGWADIAQATRYTATHPAQARRLLRRVAEAGIGLALDPHA